MNYLIIFIDILIILYLINYLFIIVHVFIFYDNKKYKV